MAFAAQFGGGRCGKCKQPIEVGQMVKFGKMDALEHDDCDDVRTTTEVEYTLPTTDEVAVVDEEEVVLVPSKFGICRNCNLELPATRICGYC